MVVLADAGTENVIFALIWSKKRGAALSKDWDSKWLHVKGCFSL